MDKIDRLLEEARLKIHKSKEEGKAILKKAYQLSLDCGYVKGEAWAIMRLGSYELSDGKRHLAIEQYEKALLIMNRIGDFQGVCRCHYSIGTVYGLMGEFEFALSHFSKAKALSLDYDDTYYTKLMHNIAETYIQLNQNDAAIRMSKQTLEYMKTHDDSRLHLPYTAMGSAYLQLEKYRDALVCAEKALKALDHNDEPIFKAIANAITASAYKGLKYYDESLIVYSRTLKLSEEAGDIQNLSEINRFIAEIYYDKKEFDYAFRHLQKAMTLSLKYRSKVDEAQAYFLYANIYETMENYKKAYESYKKASLIEKEIQSEKIQEKYRQFIEDDYEPKEDSRELIQLDRTLSELRTTYLNLSLSEKSELTDAFVEAIVDTIDQRDTTTSGHSKRIAKYCLEMMRQINDDVTVFETVQFTDEEMKEMYYASLLHDIGKLAIKESILLKRQRLTHGRIEAIGYKKAYIKSCLQMKLSQTELTDTEVDILMHIDDYYDLIQSANMRNNLDIYTISELKAIHEKVVKDCNDYQISLIDAFELEHLIVSRGNLIDDEWEHMKTHAQKTKEVLEFIPWMVGMKNVPYLASSHHEKLDGTGYPMGLLGDEISLQMRLLSIVDIFEALTASDRPYKAPLSIAEALTVLKSEANSGKLDSELINFFIEKEICYLCKDEIENKS